jgi:hypothetical protein
VGPDQTKKYNSTNDWFWCCCQKQQRIRICDDARNWAYFTITFIWEKKRNESGGGKRTRFVPDLARSSFFRTLKWFKKI